MWKPNGFRIYSFIHCVIQNFLNSRVFLISEVNIKCPPGLRTLKISCTNLFSWRYLLNVDNNLQYQIYFLIYYRHLVFPHLFSKPYQILPLRYKRELYCLKKYIFPGHLFLSYIHSLLGKVLMLYHNLLVKNNLFTFWFDPFFGF